LNATTQEVIEMDLSFLDDLWEKMTDRPPNSFTVAEAAAKWDVDQNAARKRLYRMVEEGLLERTDPSPGAVAYYWEV
jgi:Fic family protein